MISYAVLGLTWAAIALGLVVTFLALGLLDLIELITHLASTGRIGTSLSPPDTSVLGPLSVLVPIVGGLIVGAMARCVSERIRGHGIPEAMEMILLRGSRMEPRLAILKPISSAVSRMVSSGHGVLSVVDYGQPHRLVGLVSQFDLLRAHERVLVEERHRECPLAPHRVAGGLGALLPTREPA